jgi:hypothetical protein
MGGHTSFGTQMPGSGGLGGTGGPSQAKAEAGNGEDQVTELKVRQEKRS